MVKRIMEMSVGSWADAVRMADDESRRVNKTVWAIEYRERPSVDGMCFYEIVGPSTLVMLQQHYETVRLESFIPSKG